jgi:hypothetical protein
MDFCKKPILICTLGLLFGSVFLSSCKTSDSSQGTANVQSDKLDRATAEKILRDQSEALFSKDALTMDHATIENGPKELLDKLPDVEFLDELAAAGVVHERTERQEGGNTVYYYAPIAQKGISVGYPSDPRWEYVVVTLATNGIKRVTGVSQQGTDAEVETEVGLIPTDFYNRLLPKVQNTVAKCPPTGYFAYYCGRWPDQAKLSAVKTVTFEFKKFDDGWRLVQH